MVYFMGSSRHSPGEVKKTIKETASIASNHAEIQTRYLWNTSHYTNLLGI